MIVNKNGRTFSLRTDKEEEAFLQKELESLDPDERETLEVMLQELKEKEDSAGLMQQAGRLEYKTTPVDMKTFVYDPYYLGHTCDNLYPKLLDTLTEVFEGGYQECILTGCIDLDAMVQASNGSLLTIREYIEAKGPAKVPSFSPTGQVQASTAGAKYTGRLPVLRMELANGMAQCLTPDHKVLVCQNERVFWTPAERLQIGDAVVIPGKIETVPDSLVSISEVREFVALNCLANMVPDSICRASNEIVSVLTSSLFEGSLDFVTASERFARQLQLLLLRQGKLSRLTVSEQEWTVTLCGTTTSTNRVEHVVSIKPVDTREIGDIVDVAGTRNFISNGIYSHNSIGFGKCVKLSNSFIVDLETGVRAPLQAFVGKTPQVPSLSEDHKQIQPAVASKIWESGSKQCTKMVLASGQWLSASTDHPVLTPSGWKPIEQLVKGELVATARQVPGPVQPLEISDAEVAALGFFIADGCGLHFGHQTYCKSDPVLVDAFKASVLNLPGFNGFGEIRFHEGAWYVPCHGLRAWLANWGIDEKSKAKRIPGKLFGLSDAHAALLLRILWTDGSVYLGVPPRIEIGLASEGLIDDIQELLLRFGVVGRKSYKKVKLKLKDGIKEYDSWKLQVAAADHLVMFFEKVGYVLGKEAACAELLERARATKSNTNWDIVPITVEELKIIRAVVGPMPNIEWAKYGNLAKGSYMGRAKFQRLVVKFNYQGKYAKYATMPVVWEKVAKLEDIGVHEVGDLTVPGTANAVCNGIVIHNTFTASIGICRVLYELSCMVDPHRSFGLAKDSNISIVCLSVSEMLATKVVFENIVTKIDASTYFRENFPFEKTKKELRFPNSVWVASRATTDTSALGLNTISGLVDECLHGDSLVTLASGETIRAVDLHSIRKSFSVKTLEYVDADCMSPTLAVAEAFIKESTKQECFELDFEDGNILKVSGNHPVFVRHDSGTFVDDLVQAVDLKVGCTVVAYDESKGLYPTKLMDKRAIGIHQTYDISVPGKEVFFADGILVHNTNFMPKVTGAKAQDPRFAGMDRAEVIYNAIKRRMKSRFEKFGKLPGVLFIMSSKATQDDFTARRINESKNDSSIYVADYCLTGDTKIPLLSGEILTLKELTNRYSDSDERFEVYSCDPETHVIVPGKAHHPRVTARNERVLKVTLDSGESVRATASHPFMLRDGTYRRAGELRPGDGLMSIFDPKPGVVNTEDGGIEDVYDLSVETYSNFAIDIGIFLHNSLWDVKPEDYYNVKRFHVLAGNEQVPSRLLLEGEAVQLKPSLPEGCVILDVPEDFRNDFEKDLEGCFTGDTQISLLDGTTVAIKDLVGRDEFWVYSFGPDGRFYPGRGHSARRTIEGAPILEVTLDNDEKIRCTPNHKFMLRNGTYLEAKDLIAGTSLMPLYRRIDRHGYELLKSNMGGKWIHTHRLVAREISRNGDRLEEKEVVHHENFIRRDNSPPNLRIMTDLDHQALHASNIEKLHTPESWAKASATRKLKAVEDPVYRAQLLNSLEMARAVYAGSEKNIETGRRSGKLYGFGREERTPAQKKAQSINGTKNITALNLRDNPSKKPRNRAMASDRLMITQMNKTPEERIRTARKGQHSRWNHSGIFEDCAICQGLVTPNYKKRKNLTAAEKSAQGAKAGRASVHKRRHSGSMEECPKCNPTNHKVVSVVYCCGFEDVYDISVDTTHNFSLAAGVVVHNSIRDLGGISTLSVSPFIQRREKITEAIDKTRKHPFSTLVYDASRGGMYRWELLVKQTTTRKYGRTVTQLMPIINPDAPRHIHVDPSLRKDALGFCMAHISTWVDVIRSNPENPREKYKERAPFYIVDFMLRVLPPTGGEIILGDIRRLIYELSDHGFTITTVSMDSFNSADGLQQLAQKGYNALDVSVDVTPDPYDNLKTAFYENRISFYEYEPVLGELRSIEQRWTAQKKRKIDHPPKKSKDISDALAGCLWTLSQGAPTSIPLAPMKSLPAPTGDDAWLEEQQHAEAAGQRGASRNTALEDYGLLPPFLSGRDDPDDGGGWGRGGLL